MIQLEQKYQTRHEELLAKIGTLKADVAAAQKELDSKAEAARIATDEAAKKKAAAGASSSSSAPSSPATEPAKLEEVLAHEAAQKKFEAATKALTDHEVVCGHAKWHLEFILGKYPEQIEAVKPVAPKKDETVPTDSTTPPGTGPSPAKK